MEIVWIFQIYIRMLSGNIQNLIQDLMAPSFLIYHSVITCHGEALAIHFDNQ